MKRPRDGLTVEQVVERLRRSGWIAEALRAIEQRWQREAGDTVDGERFLRWLVARTYLTEQQADQLARATPAVPIAQAPPSPAAARPAYPVLSAVIVAPAANRPVDAPVAPAPEPLPPDVEIDVELVEPRKAAATPAPEPPTSSAAEIDVELAEPRHEAPPAIVSPAALPPTAPPARDIFVEPVPFEDPVYRNIAPASSWTRAWLYFFLGALGLLMAQFVGWALAHLVSIFM
jgi:hypothetical protein